MGSWGRWGGVLNSWGGGGGGVSVGDGDRIGYGGVGMG